MNLGLLNRCFRTTAHSRLTFQSLAVSLRTTTFNIQKLYMGLALCRVFGADLGTNSNLCHLQHKLIGFYNPDEKCLQRGTDWVFK